MKSARDRLPRAAVPSARDERGIALPVVLMVVVVGFALASIGALAAIGSIRNAGRDTSEKSALAVAEAGAQQALFRQNNVLTTPSYPCLVQSSGEELVASTAQADHWCATQTGTVGDGTYRYRVLPNAGSDDPGQKTISIVVEGTLNGEIRRIQVGAAAATGTPAFGGGNVVGLDSLYFHGTPDVIGTMRTNGDVTVEGSATCNGDATVGTGRHIIPSDSVCNGEVTQAATTLGPVDPGNVWGTNNNDRLTTGEDTIQSRRTVWDAGSRTLTLKNKDTVTLGGANYALCKLDMTGGSLIAAQGATVRIYFGAPEQCGGETAPIAVTGGRVTATSGNPDDLALLVVGSETVGTTVSMTGNGVVNDLVIYAPRSSVGIGGTADYNGAIAGKSLELFGTGTITGWDSTLTFTTPVEYLYKQTRFVECIGPMTLSDPDNGC